MRFFTLASLALIVAVSIATSAAALVSIDPVASTAGPVSVGGTFSVDVFASFDGTPSNLTGIFTSSKWDPTQIQFVSATNAPSRSLLAPTAYWGGF